MFEVRKRKKNLTEKVRIEFKKMRLKVEGTYCFMFGAPRSNDFRMRTFCPRES